MLGFKLLIIALLLIIIISLALAMRSMLKPQNNKPMSHYIGRRLIFSVATLLIILLAMALGWITPNPRPY
ncbi:DUF2909 family protein [Paraferrimonas sp. SM1919]|uniref:DUF2909 family protein n=1 Tax=Paraferrimonas sp. SM1919 TaxID=2662263 RepID=UPI001F08C55A|nr:DUF2909 family protein [Paraferrimonas sp. SM1919]